VVNARNELIGVITQKDIFRVFISLLGDGRRGILFALPDTLVTFKEVVKLFHTFGCCRLLSILTTGQKTPKGFLTAYVRVHDLKQEKLKDLYAGLKKTASFFM